MNWGVNEYSLNYVKQKELNLLQRLDFEALKFAKEIAENKVR